MAKPEWGRKHVCLKCRTKFYDLRRHPIACPKCSKLHDLEAAVRLKHSQAALSRDAAAKKASAVLEVDDVTLEDIPESGDLLEDTEDLEDNDLTVKKGGDGRSDES